MILHHAAELLGYTRAADDDEGDGFAEFVASSGRAVQTFAGPEVLRVKGMDLARFRKNPVVLDTHQRGSSDDVIGKATVRKEGKTLITRVRFARDEKSQRVAQKVEDGILRAVSIGFTVDPSKIRELADGEVDGDGDEEVRGPAIVLNRSELHEISIVPVPADEDALRRDFYQRCLMTEPTAEPEVTLEGELDLRAEEPPTVAEAVEAVAADDVHIINLDAERMKRNAALIRARSEERAASQAEIRAICPADLAGVLEGILLRDPDLSFEAARDLLLAERSRTHKPGGTPEPAPENTPAPMSGDAGDLYKSLTGI